MLAILGGVVFDIAPINYDDISASMSSSYASHEVVGAAKVFEHTGEGDRTITIKGTIHPEFSGGTGDLMALEAIRSAGEPTHLMLGSGFPAGWGIIKQIDQDHKHIAPGGTGREVRFTIKFERCDQPSGGFGDLLGQFLGAAFDAATEYLG